MGFGQALGQGVAAWQAEDTRQFKKEDIRQDNLRQDAAAEDNKRVNDQKFELNKMKIDDARSQRQEYNSPAAKKLRATKLKMEQMQADSLGKYLSNNFQSHETQQLKHELKQTQKVVEDQKVLTQDNNFATNTMVDMKDTGSFSDLPALNDFVGRNPLLNQVIKAPLVKFNPNDENHVREMKGQAQKQAKAQGANVEDAMISMEHMATNGFMVFDSSNSKPYDVLGMMSPTGSTKGVSKSIMAGANAKLTGDIQAKIDQTNKIDEAKKSSGSAAIKKPVLRVTSTGRDPQEVKDWADSVKGPYPAGLESMIKENESMMAKYDETIARDKMEGYFDRAVMGQTTRQETAELKSFISGLETEEKKSWLHELEQAEDISDVNDVWNNPNPTQGEVRRLDNMELTNTVGNTKLVTRQEGIETEKNTVNKVNNILGRLNELQDDVVSGRLSTAVIGEASRNLGFVEKVSQMFAGKDGGIPRDKLLASIEANTMIGKLVVDFVKATSGAAVTNEEYARLRLILAGAEGGSPAAMATAMQTFRDGIVDDLDKEKDSLVTKYKLPSTAYSLKDLKKKQTDWRALITSEGTPVALTENTVPGPNIEQNNAPVVDPNTGHNMAQPPKGF